MTKNNCARSADEARIAKIGAQLESLLRRLDVLDARLRAVPDAPTEEDRWHEVGAAYRELTSVQAAVAQFKAEGPA